MSVSVIGRCDPFLRSWKRLCPGLLSLPTQQVNRTETVPVPDPASVTLTSLLSRAAQQTPRWRDRPPRPCPDPDSAPVTRDLSAAPAAVAAAAGASRVLCCAGGGRLLQRRLVPGAGRGGPCGTGAAAAGSTPPARCVRCSDCVCGDSNSE